jgi:two-component system LytT family response regulator
MSNAVSSPRCGSVVIPNEMTSGCGAEFESMRAATPAGVDAMAEARVPRIVQRDVGLRILIVDDEPLARRKVRRYLVDEPDVIVVGECSDGPEALEAIRRERPDVLFLDVQMPVVDGFEVLRRMGGDRAPGVVFVTAHDHYAVRAFEVEALDYLVKPFDRERFRVALDRARRRLAASNPVSRAGVPADAAGRIDPRRIVLRSRGRILPLSVEKIEWIEAADNYVRVHTSQRTHLVRETLAAVEGRLDPHQFLRIHRRAIVNVDLVSEVRPSLGGGYEAQLESGEILRVGRTHRHTLRRFFGV